METKTGVIDLDLGNEIRLAALDWFERYEQPNNECRFTSVRVALNVEGVDPRHAIEIQAEASPGQLERLKLQRAILGFATELKSRFGVTLDELRVDTNDVWATFLAPDGQHVPARRR